MCIILISIFDRFLKFSASYAHISNAKRDACAVLVFRFGMPDVMTRQGTILPLIDRLHIFSSLMTFELDSEPKHLDNFFSVFGSCVAYTDRFLGEEYPWKSDISPRISIRL